MTSSVSSRIATAAPLLVALLAYACAYENPAPAEPPEQPAPLGETPDIAEDPNLAPVELDVGVAGQEEVIASINVGYGVVRFHQLTHPDGTVSIMASEEVPANVVHTPFEALTAEGHTALEVFRSIAGDREPLPVLEQSHAAEARALARPDDSVILGHFDRDAPIEKSVASCEAFVYEELPDDCGERWWGNHRIATITSGSKGLHVGQFWDYATTRHVTLGICNESSIDIRGRIGMDLGGDSSSAYSYWGWATIPPGSAWRWYDFRVVADCPCPSSGGVGCVVFDCKSPTRYRVDGDAPAGNKYLLRTAEEQAPTCVRF